MADVLTTRTCGACQGRCMAYAGSLVLRIPGGQVPDTIWKCADCGTYSRGVDFDDPTIRTHFNVTSYTVPEVENHVRLTRIGFLQYIIDLADLYCSSLPSNPRVLDVGAAYGHLLDLFRERGASCTGIEIVDWLRDRLRQRGYRAYRAAQEVPADVQFDVVAMIDSLYYVQRPGDLLRELRPRLHPDGILILRVANRTLLFNLMRVMGRTIPNDIFGDVKHNFSYRGIRQLLMDCGYQIESVILNEKGKKIATGARWLYYKLSLLASHLTGQKLTPGIILMCRPSGSAV